MSKLSQRFSRALAAGRAASKPQENAKRTNSAESNYYLLLTRGLSAVENKQAVLDIQGAGVPNQTVILVTDQRDIVLYQLPGCITEHLIDASEISYPDRGSSVQTYIRDRLGILLEKWQPRGLAALGDNAQKLLDSLSTKLP